MPSKYNTKESAANVLAKVAGIDAEHTAPESVMFVDPKQLAGEADGAFGAVVASGAKDDSNLLALRQTGFGAYVELAIAGARADMLGPKLVMANASLLGAIVGAMAEGGLEKEAIAGVKEMIDNAKRVAVLTKSGSGIFDNVLYATSLTNAYIGAATLQAFGDHKGDILDDLVAFRSIIGDPKSAFTDGLRNKSAKAKSDAESYDAVMQELRNVLEEYGKSLSGITGEKLEQAKRVGGWLREFNAEIKEKTWKRAVKAREIDADELGVLRQMNARMNSAIGE